MRLIRYRPLPLFLFHSRPPLRNNCAMQLFFAVNKLTSDVMEFKGGTASLTDNLYLLPRHLDVLCVLDSRRASTMEILCTISRLLGSLFRKFKNSRNNGLLKLYFRLTRLIENKVTYAPRFRDRLPIQSLIPLSDCISVFF